MRIEVVEKPVEKIIERVRIETERVTVGPAQAADIVLASPRACRTVLDSLAAGADAGRLSAAVHGPTLRAANRLLHSLRKARLLDDG